MDKIGNGGKGISWDTKTEVHHLKALNGVVTMKRAPPRGWPRSTAPSTPAK